MKTKYTNLTICCLAFALCRPGFAQGTAFTYQGRLLAGGQSANGTNYSMVFYLYDAPTNGNLLGNLGIASVTVSNGLFTVPLDFGSVFDGEPRWLEVSVEKTGPGGDSGFTVLSPRQSLLPTPYAIMANSASNLLGTLPAGQLSGAIPSAAFSGTYTNPLTFNNGLDQFDGTFSGEFFGPLFEGGSFNGTHFGDGSGLYNLNPAQLSGPVPPIFLGNAWKTTGNSGTTPGVNFLGTTDNEPLELRVNGQRVFQLLPDNSTNNAPDIVGGSLSNSLTGGLVGTTISGGAWNTIGLAFLFSSNNPYGDFGAYPALDASYTTIGGGFLNQVQTGATFSTVAGGALNTIQIGDVQSTIGGGFGNTILSSASWSTIAGGTHHAIGSVNGFIGGGWMNSIQTNSGYSAIVGGVFNGVQGNAADAFIGGGYENVIGPDGVGASGAFQSAIGGGAQNAIYEYASFIGGGQQNLIGPYADHSVIAGGYGNVINGSVGPAYEVIAGGQGNVVQTNSGYSVIGGGFGNTILSNTLYAVIPGGYANVAGGSGTFAAGTSAQATNNGTFVWSDTSATNAFNSTGSNQFLIRAAGGVGIGTNNPTAALHVVGSGGVTNIALRIANGGVAISGAGIETATAAFIHVANSTNTSGYITFIYNPVCDNDPNAILIATHQYSPPGAPYSYETHPFSVWYAGPHWTIYNDDYASISNMSFNVLIIKR